MRSNTFLVSAAFAALTLAACAPPPEEVPEQPVVEVIVRDFEFEAPESVPSGWNTFRLINVGAQEHFLYIYRLPAEKSFEQFLEEAIQPFGSVWLEYDRGDLTREEAEAKMGEEIAGWFFTDIVPSGGPALTEPGATSQATVRLDPGLYVIECYVKTPDGTWHTELGMQQPLTVTEEPSGVVPPQPDVEVTLSNYAIGVDGELTAGANVVAVRVTENPEGFMMHDLNLFRLDGVAVEEIVEWMDWMDLDGFKAPAPGASLGGMEHLAAGGSGFVTVELTPGEYAWVSEGYGAQGMVETFTIE